MSMGKELILIVYLFGEQNESGIHSIRTPGLTWSRVYRYGVVQASAADGRLKDGARPSHAKITVHTMV